jgi:hypothetical protein
MYKLDGWIVVCRDGREFIVLAFTRLPRTHAIEHMTLFDLPRLAIFNQLDRRLDI